MQFVIIMTITVVVALVVGGSILFTRSRDQNTPVHTLKRIKKDIVNDLEFVCSCGYKGSATGYDRRSEPETIKAFKIHAKMRGEIVSSNEWKIKYEELDAESKKFKDGCYCKDV